MNHPLLLAGSLLIPLLVPGYASATTLSVGPGKDYTTPSAAAAAARDGDTIELAAGTYRDVAIWKANNLTIRGVGGARAHLDAAGLSISNGKAIWVIQGSNTTVENIEFSGASVPDKNGAGIRQEGAGLTVRNCFFHDNENGVLAGDSANSDILIESSEFAHNGAGDGLSHNMYINHVRSFTLRFSYSHAARSGHLVKSRAYSTSILYNRLTDEDGNPSYEIELPNGGDALVLGNQIQQGTAAENSTLLSFAAEGASNPVQKLYVVNNTFVNDRTAGATFVRVSGSPSGLVANNLFVGKGTPISGTVSERSNLATSAPGLVDPAGFDYHLTAGSPAVNAGLALGSDGADFLAPMFQYVHPLGSEPRRTMGSGLDVGAFEYGNLPGPVDDGGTPDAGIGVDAGPGTGDAGMPDGGPGDGDGDGEMSDKGCGCNTSGSALGALALIALQAVMGARRRSR
ncbi:right-handed parallel beta-helix repeat-containing protein [Vitiosangium sp. GDMCC 1.1324]|uniref:right-handed parallel beta-helix repeat-containing protein n=1 Tax=Vitiosangium sp. (strain GDMCC 1.1324) TaxID=2138576 RepID=UPI0018EEC51D|nr:right-handed parallel beta-helix repeat-containing protein [Vitiosangium sp. GDMCC 1.1324]